MKIAKCKNGYILALKAELEDGPFRCPECRCEVILKKGDIYTHHFAHNPGEGCAMGDVADGEWTGESQLHQYAKKEMYEALSKHPNVTNLKVERYLGSVRPDVSFYFQGKPIAIEIQISALPPDVIHYRTKEYSRRGVSILWLSPYGEAEIRNGRFYLMRDWERIVHALYGGTFYYWTEDERLQPVHFENAQTHKSASHLSSVMEIPREREPTCITHLAHVSLSFTFTGEPSAQETKLWSIPDVWVDNEDRYLPIDEAKGKYPSLYPSVRPFPPVNDPFHAEDAPPDFILRGFVEEFVPELQERFSDFYAKYGEVGHQIFWVSIDHTPNRWYFPADWWRHFRSEYVEGSPQRKDRLVEMLQEKLSGEKPSRHVTRP